MTVNTYIVPTVRDYYTYVASPADMDNLGSNGVCIEGSVVADTDAAADTAQFEIVTAGEGGLVNGVLAGSYICGYLEL